MRVSKADAMRSLAKLLISLLVLTGLAGAATSPGQPAPGFNLNRLDGAGAASLSGLLGQGPVLVWFPDVSQGTAEAFRQLSSLTQPRGIQLVVIPVVGPDTAPAAPYLALAGPALWLADPDGAVTLAYTGEFIIGVAPRQNLFVVDRGGTVRGIRFFPGVPQKLLIQLLEGVR